MPTNPSDEPAAQAHALLERIFTLLHDCRAVVPQLERAPIDPEPVSAQPERLLCYALVGALEADMQRLLTLYTETPDDGALIITFPRRGPWNSASSSWRTSRVPCRASAGRTWAS